MTEQFGEGARIMYFLVKTRPSDGLSGVQAIFLQVFSLFFRHFPVFDLKNRKRHVILL